MIATYISSCFDVVWRVLAQRLRPPDSSSGTSDQLSVGSSSGGDTSGLKDSGHYW